MLRVLAVWAVLAWWFQQLGLQSLVSWKLDAGISRWLALIASLGLGWALQGRLSIRTRSATLPLVPLLALGGCAAWLVASPVVDGPFNVVFDPVRAYVHWVMALAVMAGTVWLALRLVPAEGVVIGPNANAPTLRLILALGLLLTFCTAAWWVPLKFISSPQQLVETLLGTPGRGDASVYQTVGQWLVTWLPVVAAAVLVWGARMGPRVLASRPGLTVMNIYLSVWVGLQAVALLVTLSRDTLIVLMLGAMVLGAVLPLFNAALAWAALHMLLSLGAGAAVVSSPKPGGHTEPRARIKRLLEQRRSADALAVYIATLAAQPGFDPGTAAVVPLTKQALKEQRPDLALRLLEVFGQRRPADAQSALFRWLHGQALVAVGRVPEGVAQLQALMLHHPENTLAREARDLLAQHGAGA